VQNLKAKSLKQIELDFTASESQQDFLNYLSNEYPESIIEHQFDTQLTFLLPPDATRKIMKDLGSHEWAGFPIKDITIQNSSLENIFMQYYKDSNFNSISKRGAI